MGDTCLGGQLPRGTNVWVTLVRGANVTTPFKMSVRGGLPTSICSQIQKKDLLGLLVYYVYYAYKVYYNKTDLHLENMKEMLSLATPGRDWVQVQVQVLVLGGSWSWVHAWPLLRTLIGCEGQVCGKALLGELCTWQVGDQGTQLHLHRRPQLHTHHSGQPCSGHVGCGHQVTQQSRSLENISMKDLDDWD